MTTNEFIVKAERVHGKKYDYSQSVYVNAKTKIQIVCPIHGCFEQTPDKHVNGKCGCPMCAGNVRDTVKSFVSKAVGVHGSQYDYSLVNYKNNRLPVMIICHKHGIFEQTPSNHLKGKGCPVCAGNLRLDLSGFVERARKVHGDFYDYSQVMYCGNRIPVKIVCPKHGIFEQRPYAHLSGARCPECGEIVRLQHRDSSAISIKQRETFRKRYGVDNPMQDGEIRQRQLNSVRSLSARNKSDETKKRNGSFNTSFPAKDFGNRLEFIFGKDDVRREYKSDAYPFRCDYYIVSRNLYIELNYHWSHHGRWYTDADESLMKEWRSKTQYYINCSVTFSVRDVEKRNVARQNRLNYVVLWNKDDAEKWISAGCPDGHDWEKEYSWLL